MALLEPQYPTNDKKHTQAKSKHAAVKEAIRRSLLLTTNHGLPNLMRTHRLLVRLTWGFFALMAFALCGAFIVHNINSYLEFDFPTCGFVDLLQTGYEPFYLDHVLCHR